MASNQEEEVIGKAYDGRLMRRLLTYLRPYKWHVVIALVAIVLKSVADVLGPFLTKIAIDKYLAKAPNSHSWIGDRLSNAIRANVAIGVETLRGLQPIIAPAVKRGQIKVVGALYDLRTGGVTLTA